MAAPRGNRNAASGTAWRDAVKHVLDDYECVGIARGQALRAIARKCVEQAIEGDKDARAEIANRLDGKPNQSVDVTKTVTHVLDRSTLIHELSRLYARHAGVDDGRRVIEAVGDSSGTGPALIEAQDR